jgi:hypothetical protein
LSDSFGVLVGSGVPAGFGVLDGLGVLAGFGVGFSVAFRITALAIVILHCSQPLNSTLS